VGLTGGFYALDWYNARLLVAGRRFWDLSFSWERRIPLRPAWVWLYMLYFPACFLPLLFPEVWWDIDVFRRTAASFGLQYLIAFPLFLLPICMVRPRFVPVTASERLLAWLYRFDPGFNIFPSLHVANTAFLACWTWRLRGALAGAIAWLFCSLIALSALFVKQHYFIDLPAGVLLGAGCYRLAFPESFE
jgi:membrane-associated phospholipid phosphatase